MSAILDNKLWAAATNSRTLDTLEKYAHVYACDDHCLIISPDKPEGFEEVDAELAPYLSNDDWGWLWMESGKIRQEQEQQYVSELREAQSAFLMRFEAALEAARTGGQSDVEEKADGTEADGAAAEN